MSRLLWRLLDHVGAYFDRIELGCLPDDEPPVCWQCPKPCDQSCPCCPHHTSTCGREDTCCEGCPQIDLVCLTCGQDARIATSPTRRWVCHRDTFTAYAVHGPHAARVAGLSPTERTAP